MTILYNKPAVTGNEQQYVLQAIESGKLSGDGPFSQKCQAWFEEVLSAKKTLMMPSCTAALEAAALLIDVQPGDEVIMPSYTFVSTANAFVLRGAKIVFVDVRQDTMNIDETRIEAAITERTRAIVPVHYAGVGCEMDAIMDIAERNNLYVIEDAAQGVMSAYKGRALGAFGNLAAFSFHETKNYTSGGEGGLLIINDARFMDRANVIREKGTNRTQFFRGMVDKYQWVDIGSSYLPSELQAAYLWGQLEWANKINENRLSIWRRYYDAFYSLEKDGHVVLPRIPEHCVHNAHMFYLRVANLKERTEILEHLKASGVMAVFHYVPLHTAKGGKKYGEFFGRDLYTTVESEKLLRLPLWYGMSEEDQERVIESVREFFV